MKKIGVYVFCTAIFLALTLPAAAQTTEIAGVAITHDDVKLFLVAMDKALKPNDMTIPIIISSKPASEMPIYDKQIHYDGIHTTTSGAHVMYIYVSKDWNPDTRGFIAPIALAVIDGGYAGKAWKELYDVCAARDAQLPTGAPDPYLNRHKLGNALEALIDSK
jgi:hypothetical protein